MSIDMRFENVESWDKMKFINFDNCSYGSRHGRYGGNAGNKDGIIFNNENWIIKYPKTTKYMRGKNLPSYTSAPLSEYIGSQIYAILGYPVHETILGIRDKNIVVACKDFQKRYGDLAEIRTIKNAANKEIEEYTNHDIPMSATGDNVILEELLLHFKVNCSFRKYSILLQGTYSISKIIFGLGFSRVETCNFRSYSEYP